MIQATGILLVILGLFAKFGALFVTIPVPVIGGILCVMSGMIASTGIYHILAADLTLFLTPIGIIAGLSNLHYVDLNSSRNLLIVGFSIFFSMVNKIISIYYYYFVGK